MEPENNIVSFSVEPTTITFEEFTEMTVEEREKSGFNEPDAELE
jgi:hypothetical protein